MLINFAKSHEDLYFKVIEDMNISRRFRKCKTNRHNKTHNKRLICTVNI
jgi:hypothetical protein